jgi:hypothetical protein
MISSKKRGGSYNNFFFCCVKEFLYIILQCVCYETVEHVNLRLTGRVVNFNIWIDEQDR